MKRCGIIITLLVSVVLLTPAVFAGGAQESGQEDFLSRLETALANSQFTEEEAQAIIDRAGQFPWENAKEADAAMVARALSLTKERQAELKPEQEAELAHELAQNAVRLEAENYEQTVVAQATLEAVRSMLDQIEVWKESERTENLGELVRSTVSIEARKAAQKRASRQQKAETGREKASEATEGTPAEEKAGAGGSD